MFLPPGPVRLGGSEQKESCTLRPCSWQLQGLNNESVPELRGQVSVEILSEIWREEGACLDLPTRRVAVVNGRFGQGRDELCKQGKSITAVTFASSFLSHKDGMTAALQKAAQRRRMRGINTSLQPIDC